jgi:hypothetical protein
MHGLITTLPVNRAPDWALSDNRTGDRLRVIVAAGKAREHGVAALRHARATQHAAARTANGAKDGYQTGPSEAHEGVLV